MLCENKVRKFFWNTLYYDNLRCMKVEKRIMEVSYRHQTEDSYRCDNENNNGSVIISTRETDGSEDVKKGSN